MTPHDTHFICLLHSAVKQNQVVALDKNGDGADTLKPVSWLSRLWHRRDPKFHEERLSKIAAITAKILAKQPRLSLHAAAEDYSLITARKFVKNLSLYKCNTPETAALKTEIAAAKIGVSKVIFDKNPGLEKFVQANHLERYLLHYGQNLEIDSTTNEASILKAKEFIPWKQASEEIKGWDPFINTPRWNWFYGQDGLQRKDLYEWSELTPYKKGDPAEWNNEYVFEICACYNPESTKNGNHSWIRLKTPSGDIYSVGLYRPDKPDLTHNFKTPFRTKPGYLMQPDVSEFWDFSISTMSVKITEEIFLKMKEQIEKDKKSEALIFHMINRNCLLYCKSVGKHANLDIPTEEHLTSFLFPEKVLYYGEKGLSYLPQCIQRVCRATAAFFFNTFQLILGANATDSTLNPKQKEKATPHIRSLGDLFDSKKNVLHHPSTFAFKTLARLEKWRKQVAAEIKEIEKINEIAFSLPPEFYTQH